MENELSYTYRLSLFQKEKTYILTDLGIICRDAKSKDVFIPYKEISTIQFYITPQSDEENSDIFNVYLYRKKKKHTIRSQSLRSFMTFDNQKEEYTPFVKELINRVLNANPEVKIISGSATAVQVGKISFYIIFVVFIATFIILGIIKEKQFLNLTSGIILAVVLSGFYTGFRKLNSLKPKEFDKYDIPDEMFP